jgi:phosphate transport system protein
MILKMNGEMERVGDLLNGIGKSLIALENLGAQGAQKDITELLKASGKMFKDAINSFLSDDVSKAHEVLTQDDFVDAERNRIITLQLEEMAKDPRNVERLFNLIKITQKIERIADHATNLCEDIIYIIEGRDVKALPSM